MSWQAVILGLLVLLDLGATLAVLRNPALSSGQRAFQAVLVWLLPPIGAVVCLVFASMDAREEARSLSQHDPLLHPNDAGAPVDGPSLCGCAGDGGGD